MEEKNKSVKNVKVNQENVKKNFQYKLKRAFAIVGTVIVIGSGIGIHFSREKKDKENVNSYLSGISVSESISEYEQLKQIKIEDIKDWLEISEDSIKYEDEVVKILKDNTDYKPELHIVNSLDEYKKAVETIENLYGKVLSPEQKALLIEAALILSKNAQLANEKLMKYGYNLVEKETLRLLKEDFAKHVGINFEDLSEIVVDVPSDSLEETTYISMRNFYYEFDGGYVPQIANSIAAVQRAKEGESKESDVFGYNDDRTKRIKEAYEAYKFLVEDYTVKEQWGITKKRPHAVTDERYNCETRTLEEIKRERTNLTEGRSR